MSIPRILVIAPDTPLRHSLAFALTAEHLEVVWRASIGALVTPGDFGCTILDHHGLGSDIARARRFLKAFRPVILLANQAHELSPLAFRTLVKPGLGAPLIQAVRDALGSKREGTT